jgi:trehalose synthase-fused probable maltokinase
VAQLATPQGTVRLLDGLGVPGFGRALLASIARRRRLPGRQGSLASWGSPAFRREAQPLQDAPDPTVIGAEQSNTSIVFGNRFILKCFRRMAAGLNPDLEIGEFLTERAPFPSSPEVAGAIDYRQDGEPSTFAILHRFVPNEGDAWRFTLDAVHGYLEVAAAQPREAVEAAQDARSIAELAAEEPPPLAYETIGSYLAHARLLGERTAQLHLALASGTEPPFAPEPFTAFAQRSAYQGLRTLVLQALRMVRPRGQDNLDVAAVLAREAEIIERCHALLDLRITSSRIRIHGDYHLGQVLWTGKDFVIIDFEGEPSRPPGERRLKRSALQDVAGMIRSFHYAASTALAGGETGPPPVADPVGLAPWAGFWYRWVSAAFLRTYLDTAGAAPFVPRSRVELKTLLDVLLLGKAVYELQYEASHRPDWIGVPARAILELLGSRL